MFYRKMAGSKYSRNRSGCLAWNDMNEVMGPSPRTGVGTRVELGIGSYTTSSQRRGGQTDYGRGDSSRFVQTSW